MCHWQFVFFWTKGFSPPKKLYPTTANLHCKITLKILTKFTWDLFAKFSHKSSPQKLYPWSLNSTNRSLPKFEKKLRCLGYNFWGELLSPKLFKNFTWDLFLKNCTFGVSILQTDLYQNLKRNWDVRGIIFFCFFGGGDFCGVQKPRNSRGDQEKPLVQKKNCHTKNILHFCF